MARASHASVITPRLLTSPQAASYLGVSETKLRELVAGKRIAEARIDGCVRFDVRQLDRFVDRLSPDEDENPVDRLL
jgi:excisionase family DNA binding protein